MTTCITAGKNQISNKRQNEECNSVFPKSSGAVASLNFLGNDNGSIMKNSSVLIGDRNPEFLLTLDVLVKHPKVKCIICFSLGFGDDNFSAPVSKY